MGHLGHLKEEYQDLVRRLDAGAVGYPEPTDERARAAWREILELLYSPEEAAIASRLPVMPSSLKRVAARVGQSPGELEPKLARMAERGLVLDIIHPRTKQTRYMLAPPVVGFFEFSLMRMRDDIPQRRLAEALDAYCHGDRAFAEEVFGGDTVIGRALVHEEPLRPEDRPDVLDWQRASAILDDADKVTVSLCYCRHKAEHLGKPCDFPQETCLSLNVGAEFVARRGFGREIDRKEAREILEMARSRGLVQIADNIQNHVTYICNCCGCCCGQLAAINEFDLPAVNPSGYEPGVDAESCRGCSRCARACPVGAITMRQERRPGQIKGELRPSFDLERCIGCGVCGTACKRGALTMREGTQPRSVPTNAIERVVRMSLERGKLPHLIVDGGNGRGSRFLNGVLQAICRLPLAERAIASEQLKSRFVRFALGTVRDPSGS